MSTRPIAVVGAGIVGCLVAREIISRRPGTRVVVLDRDIAGGGASRRSAGLHFPRGTTERVRQMSAYSEDYYRELRRELPDAPIYPLSMVVVALDTPAERVREVYLDRADLTPIAAVAGLRLSGDARAWLGNGAQYADVYGLTQAIARDLRGHAEIREGVAVRELVAEAGGVRLLLSTGEVLRAERVVLAPGPWAAAAPWRTLTEPLGVRVKKVVALHLDSAPADEEPVLVFHDEDAFLMPVWHRRHRLFSYTCQEWDVDPDALHGGLVAEHLAQARAVLDRYAPELAQRCTAGRVFCDAYSPDRQPVIRLLEDAGRIVFAGAANGSGYRLAPAIAAAAADQLDLS